MLIVRWLKLLSAVSFLIATGRLIGLGQRRPHDLTREHIKTSNADESGYEPREQERSRQAAPPRGANNRLSPGDERQQRCERRYWIVTGITSVVATVATVVAAAFAIGAYNASLDTVREARNQVIAASEANEINRRVLASSEGASVYFGSVFHMADTVQPDGTTKATIRFKIGNSGGSTTRFLTYQSACADSVESRTDPFDWNVLATKPVNHVALPPKSDLELIACTFEFSKVMQLALHNPWIYVFGLATYRDTTNSNTWHRVEFCLMSHGFGASANSVTTIQSQCEHHNCADDECEAQ